MRGFNTAQSDVGPHMAARQVSVLADASPIKINHPLANRVICHEAGAQVVASTYDNSRGNELLHNWCKRKPNVDVTLQGKKAKR